MTGHGRILGTRPGGAPGRASRGGPSRLENVTAMTPFSSGVTATLAGRPADCECPWVPVFAGVPGEYQVGDLFQLKFANRFCSHHRRYATPLT